jgi:hypothetical protein
MSPLIIQAHLSTNKEKRYLKCQECYWNNECDLQCQTVYSTITTNDLEDLDKFSCCSSLFYYPEE